MQEHYGKENLNRLSRDVKVAVSTGSRMKAQETSVGVEVVDRLADYFRVEPWHLLMPDFDPDRPVMMLAASAMAADLASILDAIPNPEKKQRAYTLMAQVAELCGTQG